MPSLTFGLQSIAFAALALHAAAFWIMFASTFSARQLLSDGHLHF